MVFLSICTYIITSIHLSIIESEMAKTLAVSIDFLMFNVTIVDLLDYFCISLLTRRYRLNPIAM